MKRWQVMIGGVVAITAAALAWTFFDTPASAPVDQGPVPTPLARQAQIDTLAGEGVGGLPHGAGEQARVANPYALSVESLGVAHLSKHHATTPIHMITSPLSSHDVLPISHTDIHTHAHFYTSTLTHILSTTHTDADTDTLSYIHTHTHTHTATL